MRELIKPINDENKIEHLYSAQCDENGCEIDCQKRNGCDINCSCAFDWFSDDNGQPYILF